ncbi:MAG: hypothetical protein HXY22_12800 [Alphaproteobacteria bacterium]|nr:hypothetical protein [Alphaproteobacteria bacterium]
MLHLLWQTWRSVVSVIVSTILLILTGVFFPNEYNLFYDYASSVKDYFVYLAGPEGVNNPEVGAAVRTFVGEQSFLMTMYFLFTRIVVLTVFLFVWNLIWELVFGRPREDY